MRARKRERAKEYLSVSDVAEVQRAVVPSALSTVLAKALHCSQGH